jgi:hypothetical protein
MIQKNLQEIQNCVKKGDANFLQNLTENGESPTFFRSIASKKAMASREDREAGASVRSIFEEGTNRKN